MQVMLTPINHQQINPSHLTGRKASKPSKRLL